MFNKKCLSTRPLLGSYSNITTVQVKMITKANKTISNFSCGDVVLFHGYKSRVKSTAIEVMGGGKDKSEKLFSEWEADVCRL